jgi:hypothetical protein
MAKTGFPGIGAPKNFEAHAKNKKHEQRWSMGAIGIDRIPGGSLGQSGGQPPAVVPVAKGQVSRHKLNLNACAHGVG